MAPNLKEFMRRQKQFRRESEHEKYRYHDDVPWIESPLLGAEGAESDELVFHQRHEANTLELFFDLFFVANLATFTAYHTISDASALFAYIGFFAVLWTTWFQITLHDVRFARDSKYERLCKLGQMIVFVSFALVGSKFKMPSLMAEEDLESKDNKLAIQYAVVVIFTVRKGGYERLILPLCLNTIVYATSTIIFGAMSVAFLAGAEVDSSIVSLWWIVMFLEGVSTIVISSFWRMLSFKATHLVERMGLLTLIVIGEGAIGVTKTVSKLMGKSDTLDPVAIGQIISIILILLFLWALYFDNQPHGHYGTIKQQIWSVLHFPLHLAIVGIAEGSQQIAQTRIIIYNMAKFTSAVLDYCVEKHLDGSELGEKLNATVAYYQFESKLETKMLLDSVISPQIQLLTSAVHRGVCNEANSTLVLAKESNSYAGIMPSSFDELAGSIITALSTSMGIKLDPGKLAKADPRAMAWESFTTVYLYWWSSLTVLLLCFMAFLYMIRRHKADLADYLGQGIRGAMVMLCACALGVGATKPAFLQAAVGRPYLLPVGACILATINYFDKLARQLANKRVSEMNHPVSIPHKTIHHGHAHYEQLGHDPEKDPSIKGNQLKRRPPLELVEMNSMEDLTLSRTTGHRSIGSVAGQKPTQPRDVTE